jgi:hypothetical protein
MPASSYILNIPTGFTGMRQPGKVGSERQTSASSASPSWPRGSGKAAQEHALEGEEIAGADAGRLGAQELAPARTRPPRGRAQSGAREQPPNRCWRYPQAEFRELTADSPMAPAWILACEPQHHGPHLG